jgi:hypothetical protein
MLVITMIGMLVKEMTKPRKDFQERKESIQELHNKEEFQADEEEPQESYNAFKDSDGEE